MKQAHTEESNLIQSYQQPIIALLIGKTPFFPRKTRVLYACSNK